MPSWMFILPKALQTKNAASSESLLSVTVHTAAFRTKNKTRKPETWSMADFYSTRTSFENNGNALFSACFLWQEDNALLDTFLPHVACSSALPPSFYEVLRISPRAKTAALCAIWFLVSFAKRLKRPGAPTAPGRDDVMPTASHKHRTDQSFLNSYSCSFKNRVFLVHKNSLQMLLTESKLFSQHFKCDL